MVGWKTLSREIGPKGITVNSIAPGWIDTERIREVHPDGPSEDDLRAIPLRRLGTPREIGDVVAFLCSDRAAYVTGTVVSVDGGLVRGFIESPQRSPVKRFAGIAVALGVVGLVTAFTLWILPAEEFIFTPHEAKPLAERIQVEGSHPRRWRRLLRRRLRAQDDPTRGPAPRSCALRDPPSYRRKPFSRAGPRRTNATARRPLR